MAVYATNVTVLGVSVDDVCAAMADVGVRGFVAGDPAGVVVFGELDVGDVESPVAAALSAELGVVAVACSVHDEVFVMFVYADGDLLVAGAVAGDSDETDDVPLLDADAVVSAVGRGRAEEVGAVLRADVSAVGRHERLAAVLGLPVWPVGWGFEHLDDGADGWDGPPLTLVDV